MAVLSKYGSHRWTYVHRSLQTTWKEQIKCSNCHVADLYLVGNQFESRQGNYLVVVSQNYHGFVQTCHHWQNVCLCNNKLYSWSIFISYNIMLYKRSPLLLYTLFFRSQTPIKSVKHHPWFQTFAVFCMLYVFFWIILRRLNFICRRFGKHCSIFIGK
jgi:hypothetical protein